MSKSNTEKTFSISVSDGMLLMESLFKTFNDRRSNGCLLDKESNILKNWKTLTTSIEKKKDKDKFCTTDAYFSALCEDVEGFLKSEKALSIFGTNNKDKLSKFPSPSSVKRMANGEKLGNKEKGWSLGHIEASLCYILLNYYYQKPVLEKLLSKLTEYHRKDYMMWLYHVAEGRVKPELQKRNKELITENKKLLEEVKDLKDANTKLKASNGNLQTKIKNLTSDNFSLQGVVKNLKDANAKLKTSSGNLQTKIKNLTSDNFSLQGVVKNLKDANAELKSSNGNLQAEIKNLTSDNFSLQGVEKNLKDANAELKASNGNLQAEIKNLTSDNFSLQGVEKNLKDANTELKSSNDNLQTEIENHISDKKELFNELEDHLQKGLYLKTFLFLTSGFAGFSFGLIAKYLLNFTK